MNERPTFPVEPEGYYIASLKHTSKTHEHYECKVCGKRVALDYDEMR